MSARRSRAVFLLLIVFIAALMFLLNSQTPLMMDDYDYSFSWATGERLAGVGDIIRSQAAHYMAWGGRSVTHFLAQLFLYLGKPVFNAANACMYVLLLLEIYALAKRRETAWDWRPILMGHLLLFTGVEFFGVAFLWLDGACNYLWGTALALVPLLIGKSEREGGLFDSDQPACWLAVPISFLAGWTNENTACGVLGALILLLIWDVIRRRKIRAWRAVSLAAQAIGVCVMLLAPGNFARAAEEASRSFVMEMLYRAAVVCYCSLRYAGIPAGLCIIAMIVAVKKKVKLRCEWLCVLVLSAVLSAGALIGSPQISDRSFTAVIVLAVASLLCVMADKKPEANLHSLHVGAALGLVCVMLGVHAYGAVSEHADSWRQQVAAIELAAQEGEAAVTVSSVPSASRYTMDIALSSDPLQWPNSTLGKYYAIGIAGK
ncbi:MAG: hypothetical protein IJ418_15575 [Clostridia bacterium]|nr:hypothetical protein [Clostridia bacterium]